MTGRAQLKRCGNRVLTFTMVQLSFAIFNAENPEIWNYSTKSFSFKYIYNCVPVGMHQASVLSSFLFVPAWNNNKNNNNTTQLVTGHKLCRRKHKINYEEIEGCLWDLLWNCFIPMRSCFVGKPRETVDGKTKEMEKWHVNKNAIVKRAILIQINLN